MRMKIGVVVFAMLMAVTAAWGQFLGPTDIPVPLYSDQAMGPGGKAMAMGGAFMAVADDATAAWWNPAGIAQMEQGLDITLSAKIWNGFSADAPGYSSTLFTRTPYKVAYDKYGGFDFASIAYPIRKGNWNIVPQVSYQRVVTQDLDANVDFQYVFDGRQYIFNQTVDNSGGYDVLTLTGAVGNGKYHAGASIHIWMNGFDAVNTMTNRSFYDATEIRESFSADASGTNLTLGFLGRPHDIVDVAFVFRTPFDLKSNVVERARSGGITVARQGEVTVKWPWTIGFGGAFEITKDLTGTAEYNFSNWSNADTQETTYFSWHYPVYVKEGMQNDSWQIRTGIEWMLEHNGQLFPLRAGYYYDRQYYIDANGDKVSYNGVTYGAGWVVKMFTFDFAVAHEFGNYLGFGDLERTSISATRVLLTGNLKI
ncbi:OmpP1/FadL family transporter [Acidobacteriota bacterium]